ncbi:MAG: hemolysin family protein, partial [Candidatus Cloacimonadota bacterium]|nr:hemolysin family protein [Candidatus Cloacimonadota bacterium]
MFKILVLLVLSAFFSGSETAFFSLSNIQQKKIENEKFRTSKFIISLLSKPKQLLITILLGNTLVNILAATQAALITVEFSQRFNIGGFLPQLIQMFVMTTVLLFFGEITPKLFAFSISIKFARFSSPLIGFLRILLFPLIYLLEKLSNLFIIKESENSKFEDISQDELKLIINSTIAKKTLGPNEEQIIKHIYRLPTTKAEDIMVPRVDMVSVNLASGKDNLKEVILSSGYSKIPIYKKNMDNIIGIVYAKDVILYPHKNTIKSLMKKPYFITENMKLNDLLFQLKLKRVHIAIVIDEYGGTSGLVTLEDILEELVGEIQDEFDSEIPSIVSINKNNYKVQGVCPIREFNDFFDVFIDNSDYENVAAYLFD